MAPQAVGEGQYFLSGDYLAAVRDFATSKGISATELLKGSQLPMEALLSPPPFIGDVSMHRVGLNLIAALDDPLSASIDYGQRITLNVHGALGVAIQGKKNLFDASGLLAQYFETRSNFKKLERVVDDTNQLVRLRITQKDGGERNLDDKIRLFFDFAMLINIDLLGRQLLSKVDFTSRSRINVDMPEPDNFPHQRLADSVEVHFDQPFFELCVPMQWMQVPLSIANTELAELAASQCENELQALNPKDLVVEIRHRLRAAKESKPTIDEMASELFMSTSTLQRRLKEQHTTYQQIKSE